MKSLQIITALFIGLASSTLAFAHDYNIDKLIIDHPTMRLPIGNSKVTAGYMAIKNNGADDRLISATSDVAKKVELHTMSMEGEVMRMRQLENGIELPAGDVVELKKGGLHIMFMGMQREISHGEFVSVELEFEKAGKVSLDFQVDEALTPKHGDGHKMDHSKEEKAHDHSHGHGHDHSGHKH